MVSNSLNPPGRVLEGFRRDGRGILPGNVDI
jgi:hypothetical protein